MVKSAIGYLILWRLRYWLGGEQIVAVDQQCGRRRSGGAGDRRRPGGEPQAARRARFALGRGKRLQGRPRRGGAGSRRRRRSRTRAGGLEAGGAALGAGRSS